MYSIQRKTISDDARSILLRAAREQQPLVWDRFEAMQPQCGFGRLALSCTGCLEGPCRINPFAEGEQQTICGRTRADLVAAHLLQSVSDGAAALAALAGTFGLPADKGPAAASSNDSLSGADDIAARLESIAPRIRAGLAALSGAEAAAGSRASTAGMGSLDEKQANIILHGFVPANVIGLLRNAAKAAGTPLALHGICGAEGFDGVSSIATYGSQELPLLSGKADAVVTGGQCVTPAFRRLAKERGIALAPAAFVSDEASAAEFVGRAAASLKERGAKAALPTGRSVPFSGIRGNALSPDLAKALQRGVNQGVIAGLAFIGGCGNVKNTQDAGLVNLAAELLADGYLVVAAGCVATALARNGLCSADAPMPETLRAALPQGAPPVLHLGPCYAAGTFAAMAETCAAANIPTLAVIAEPVHNKASAIAVGLAASGIPTYFDLELFPWLPENMLHGNLLPLSALRPDRRGDKAAS